MNINVPKPRRPLFRRRIHTEFDGADFVLSCPRCGDGYLHHRRVAVFSRPREDGPVTVTVVDETGRVEAGRTGLRNPSSRRDGLTVAFWCEGCGATDIELMIRQCKGNTLAEWRVAAPDCGCEQQYEMIDGLEDVS